VNDKSSITSLQLLQTQLLQWSVINARAEDLFRTKQKKAQVLNSFEPSKFSQFKCHHLFVHIFYFSLVVLVSTLQQMLYLMWKNVDELRNKVISEQRELECVKNTNKLHTLVTAQVSDVLFFFFFFFFV
jgi:hypothetical protein